MGLMPLVLAAHPLSAPCTLGVVSSAFRPGELLPERFTEAGEDVSPPLDIGGMPPGARAFALVMEDVDATEDERTRWTFWNMPATVTQLPPGVDVGRWVAMEGRTAGGGIGYRGPQPDGREHRCHFRVFALCEPLRLPPGAPAADVWAAMQGRCLAWGETVGIA